MKSRLPRTKARIESCEAVSWGHVNCNPQTVAANAARLQGFATKAEFAEMRSQRVAARNLKASSHVMHMLNQRADFKVRCVENARRLNSSSIIAAKRDAAIKKYWALKRREAKRAARLAAPKPEPVKCPPWVPEELKIEFFQWAQLFGEHEAASHIRKLKREMERPYV